MKEQSQISIDAAEKANYLLLELFRHCKENDIPMLLFISPDRKNHLLSGNGFLEIFEELIEYGASINEEIRLAILNTSLKLI